MTFSRCSAGGGCVAQPPIAVSDAIYAAIVANGTFTGNTQVCTLRFSPSVASPPPDGASIDTVVEETVGAVTSVQFDGFEAVYDGSAANPYAAWEDPFTAAFSAGTPLLIDARVGFGGAYTLGEWLYQQIRASSDPYGMVALPRTAYDGADPPWLFAQSWNECDDTNFVCQWSGGQVSFAGVASPPAATTKVAWVNGDDVSMNDITPRLLAGRASFRVFGPHPSRGAYGEISKLPPIGAAWGVGSMQVLDSRFGTTPATAIAAPWGERQRSGPGSGGLTKSVRHFGRQRHGAAGGKGVAEPMTRSMMVCALIAVVGAGCNEPKTTPRTLTTRPLWGTSVQSVLLDPFVTSDTSWGTSWASTWKSSTDAVQVPLYRDFVSQSPAGVTVPVAHYPSLTELGTATATVQVVAPFSGGTPAMAADVWVAATDESNRPVPWKSAASGIAIALLPNDQPTASYPLSPTGEPQIFGGQSWTKLAMTPAPLPDGGWLSLTISDASHHYLFQAPEIYPAAASAAERPASRPREAARATLVFEKYTEIAEENKSQIASKMIKQTDRKIGNDRIVEIRHPDELAVYCSDGRFTAAVESLLRELGHARLGPP